MFGLLAFLSNGRNDFFGIDFCVIKYERKNLNHKATRDIAKRSALGGGVYT